MDAETHAARQAAHASFDRLWQEFGWERDIAYEWLAVELNVPEAAAHMRAMDAETAQRVVTIVTSLYGAPPLWTASASSTEGWRTINTTSGSDEIPLRTSLRRRLSSLGVLWRPLCDGDDEEDYVVGYQFRFPDACLLSWWPTTDKCVWQTPLRLRRRFSQLGVPGVARALEHYVQVTATVEAAKGASETT